jgi:ribosomal protein S14
MTMESKHFTGDDNRDTLSARTCDRCDERDAVKTWDHLYVCAPCFRELENYEPAAPTYDETLWTRYPKDDVA